MQKTLGFTLLKSTERLVFVGAMVCMAAWSLSLEAIGQLAVDPALKPFTKPSLFINGALSVKVDEQLYRKAFPECKILSIEGAGHYVHTDKPKLTLEAIALFLESVEK